LQDRRLEIVFLLSQNNYFALLKHNAPIMKLLSLFLLILYCYFQKTRSPKKLLLPRSLKDRARHSFSLD
jgi:hypothetical protein